MWIVELLLLAALCILGFRLARLLARSPRGIRAVGIIALLALVLMVGAARRAIALSFVWPLSWVSSAYVTPYLMALVLPALLSTLCRQLPRARERRYVGLLIWVGLLYFAFIPIALPALVRPFLADTPTSIDPSGVCRQEHVYSCGPAAAVTALLRLGVPAEEGAIGVGADTSPVTGTDPQMLTDTINRLYGRFGVHAEYRLFTDFADLTAHTPAIVSLRLSTAANHYVTVLGVRGNGVVIGDPLQGLTIIGRDQFEAAWYSAGIAVARAPPAVGSGPPDTLE